MNQDKAFGVIVRPLKERVAAGLIAGIFLAIAVGAAGYGLIELASAAKEILVAVIAGSASLLSAIFAYVFQRARDLEIASLQRQRELEGAERMAKQEQYTRILEHLAPYVRSPKGAMDEFTTAYLQTWVSGSADVIEATNEFLRDPCNTALDQVLMAMRKDLSLEDRGSLGRLRRLSSAGLFPIPESLGGLASR